MSPRWVLPGEGGGIEGSNKGSGMKKGRGGGVLWGGKGSSNMHNGPCSEEVQ